MKKEFKLLGHCQVCGRVQAVNGGMSKHGYTVKHGWFQGVCHGEGHLPMEQDDKVTKQVCESIAKDCLELDQLVADLQSGKKTPEFVAKTGFINGKWSQFQIPFAEAKSFEQHDAVKGAIYNNEFRARQGRSHIEVLTKLSAQYLGKELVQEAKQPKAPAIRNGEKRQAKRGVVTCRYTYGQRVYWKDERGVQSYTSPRAWRAMPLVE